MSRSFDLSALVGALPPSSNSSDKLAPPDLNAGYGAQSIWSNTNAPTASAAAFAAAAAPPTTSGSNTPPETAVPGVNTTAASTFHAAVASAGSNATTSSSASTPAGLSSSAASAPVDDFLASLDRDQLIAVIGGMAHLDGSAASANGSVPAYHSNHSNSTSPQSQVPQHQPPAMYSNPYAQQQHHNMNAHNPPYGNPQMSPSVHTPRTRDASMDANFSRPSRQLFVGNINFLGQNPELERIFSSFGELESINYYSHLRFAFFIYRHMDSAIRAREACAANPPMLCGRKLIVNYGKPIGPSFPSPSQHGPTITMATPNQATPSYGARTPSAPRYTNPYSVMQPSPQPSPQQQRMHYPPHSNFSPYQQSPHYGHPSPPQYMGPAPVSTPYGGPTQANSQAPSGIDQSSLSHVMALLQTLQQQPHPTPQIQSRSTDSRMSSTFSALDQRSNTGVETPAVPVVDPNLVQSLLCQLSQLLPTSSSPTASPQFNPYQQHAQHTQPHQPHQSQMQPMPYPQHIQPYPSQLLSRSDEPPSSSPGTNL